jgi:hypothetical protein
MSAIQQSFSHQIKQRMGSGDVEKSVSVSAREVFNAARE